ITSPRMRPSRRTSLRSGRSTARIRATPRNLHLEVEPGERLRGGLRPWYDAMLQGRRVLKIQPSDREGDPDSSEEPGPSRPELTPIDGGLHLPGSVLVDEALGGGKTRLRRGLRATLLGGALLLMGAGISAAVADAWFLALGIAGAASTEGAFVCHEAGL